MILTGKHRRIRGTTRPIVNFIILIHMKRLYLAENSMFLTETIHQYSKTNVMPFIFNLLRINGLYMLRSLLAHPQEALRKRHMVCCVRVMSLD
jgi:hypothetical protein